MIGAFHSVSAVEHVQRHTMIEEEKESEIVWMMYLTIQSKYYPIDPLSMVIFGPFDEHFFYLFRLCVFVIHSHETGIVWINEMHNIDFGSCGTPNSSNVHRTCSWSWTNPFCLCILWCMHKSTTHTRAQQRNVHLQFLLEANVMRLTPFRVANAMHQ